MTPKLYIFSGLPGAGKSTLAKGLAQAIHAMYLRIDTIEQALRDICAINVEGEGYRLSYRIAKDNLLNEMSVVADSCNPIELTRMEWEAVAKETNSNYVNIEVICSDSKAHQRRVEQRVSEIEGLNLPDWKAVQSREYDPWKEKRLIIDTSNQTKDESLNELLRKLDSP